MPPDLQTSRLRFREMTLDDLDFIAGMLAHPEVMRYYTKCYSRDESEEWICRQLDRYAGDGCGLWLVTDKERGVPVGQVGLINRRLDGEDAIEVGYLIDRPFWRHGFATEAATACRDFAFCRRGEPRVIALIRPENVPSQGVARKLGMTPGKHITFAGFEHIVFSVCRASPIASECK